MSTETSVKQKKTKSASSSKKRKLEEDATTEPAEVVAESSNVVANGDAEGAVAEPSERRIVNEELEPEPDAVSHAEQRKRRKLEKKRKVASTAEDGEVNAEPAEQTATSASDANKEKRSGHGVWVGNLSFKTDGEKLKKFFEPCGVITRLHMPKGGQKFAQNKGFAYIDFEDPVGVTTAISMSEQNLDGRRLLIKDSKSFEGRPKSVATEAVTAAATGSATGSASIGDKSMSKTARKILDRQKNPPAPTLFVGNLGFETTVEMIKEAVEAHFQAAQAWEKKTKKDRKRATKGKEKAVDNEDGASSSGSDSDADEDAAQEEAAPAKADAGIRKVRIGTFEDSGKCKGWAFIDFLTAKQATAALVNGKNHYLNGRALTLEFASADAVRRGGGRMDGAASVSGPAKGERRQFEKRRQRPDHDEAVPGEGAEEEDQPVKQAFYRPPLETNPYAASEASRAAAAIIQAGGKLHKPNKAERKVLRDQKAKEERDNSKRRVKPGAALADAKREKMAILPAAGKKVLFED